MCLRFGVLEEPSSSNISELIVYGRMLMLMKFHHSFQSPPSPPPDADVRMCGLYWKQAIDV